MFFWGSYSFHTTALTAGCDDAAAPLRYPVYVPPAPLHFTHLTPSGGNGEASNAPLPPSIDTIQTHRLQVGLMACGQKHILATLAIVPKDAGGAPLTYRLFGMGNNQAGQLGPAIPSYATTFAPLHLEDRLGSPPQEQGPAPQLQSLACGARHSLFVTCKGDVYACGDNSMGQVGIPSRGAGRRRGYMAGGRGAAATHHNDRNAANYVNDFQLLPFPNPVHTVAAGGNVSYALDTRGRLYSWGDPQFGQLGLGDNGERVNTETLQLVTEPVSAPTVVEWFQQRHIPIVEVSVGKSHMVCRSEEEVYAVGAGTFGKLGTGDVSTQLWPVRVKFPETKQPERLVSLACGDEHTIVLKQNPVVGATVYFFGKLSNGDGQLLPVVLPFPSPTPSLFSSPHHQPFASDAASTQTKNLIKVFAGRGTQCAAVSAEGTLWVWGKHTSPAIVTNGTPASCLKSVPSIVSSVLPHRIKGVCLGGSMVVAYASGLKPLPSTQEEHRFKAEEEETKAEAVKARWEVVVPHDDRVGVATGRQGGTSHPHNAGAGDPEQWYEKAVQSFLQQYFGQEAKARALAAAYLQTLPVAPARTPSLRSLFARKRTRELEPGDKVRLWMTDVYALGTVGEVLGPRRSSDPSSPITTGNVDPAPGSPPRFSSGVQLKINWLRDDWDEEVLSLYSDDETLDSANPNRWQPFWFDQQDTAAAGI